MPGRRFRSRLLNAALIAALLDLARSTLLILAVLASFVLVKLTLKFLLGVL